MGPFPCIQHAALTLSLGLSVMLRRTRDRALGVRPRLCGTGASEHVVSGDVNQGDPCTSTRCCQNSWAYRVDVPRFVSVHLACIHPRESRSIEHDRRGISSKSSLES